MNRTYKITLTLTDKQWDALKNLVSENDDKAFEFSKPSDPNRKMAHELYEALMLTKAKVVEATSKTK